MGYPIPLNGRNPISSFWRDPSAKSIRVFSMFNCSKCVDATIMQSLIYGRGQYSVWSVALCQHRWNLSIFLELMQTKTFFKSTICSNRLVDILHAQSFAKNVMIYTFLSGDIFFGILLVKNILQIPRLCVIPSIQIGKYDTGQSPQRWQSSMWVSTPPTRTHQPHHS